MFASLKNKIKEETGSDVSVVTSRLTSDRRSRQGSSSNSSTFDDLSYKEQEKNVEIAALRTQYNELLARYEDLSMRFEASEVERARLESTNDLLEESVRVAQSQKELICDEQDKIQNIQSQEIAKLKSMLLFREQEAIDRLSQIKQNQQLIDNYKNEIDRLKDLQPLLEDAQEQTCHETKNIRERLEKAEERLGEYHDNSEKESESLQLQCGQLQEQIRGLTISLESEKQEKHTAFLRNAEISQREEILKQKLRSEEGELTELNERLSQMRDELDTRDSLLTEMQEKLTHHDQTIKDQSDKLVKMTGISNELNEKNKSIKNLHQRMIDMKKMLHQEMKSNNSASSVVSAIEAAATYNGSSTNGPVIMDEVNFKYLKHVIVKFLTSREVEARHLIRAVSTLLRLTNEEEKLLHDTLTWKMSWFGSKPDVYFKHKNFSIPPS